MSFSFESALASGRTGPVGMSQLSGPGVPAVGVSHGTSGQNVSAVFQGIGAPSNGGLSIMHVGQHTSTMDPVSQPRGVISTQFFIDLDKTDVNADIGDQELHFMWVDGPPGFAGQTKPHRFATLSRLNYWLKLPAQRAAFGHEKSTRWFNDMLSFAGVLRHDGSKHLPDASASSYCQLFETHFTTRIHDVFQAFEPPRATGGALIGPEIGDLLQLYLRKYELSSEMDRALPSSGEDAIKNKFYWQLAPYYSKANERVPVYHLYNRQDNSMGQSFIIGRVSGIYGSTDNPQGARALARKIIWHPTSDGSYKQNLLKLRTLQIEVGCV